jgi:hypothetical protein
MRPARAAGQRENEAAHGRAGMTIEAPQVD